MLPVTQVRPKQRCFGRFAFGSCGSLDDGVVRCPPFGQEPAGPSCGFVRIRGREARGFLNAKPNEKPKPTN